MWQTFITVLMSLAPLIFFVVSFLVTMFFLFRGQGVSKLAEMVKIFLKEPATVKTWGLFMAGPILCLLLNAILSKIGDNASWPSTDAVAMARIQFYREVAIGLEILISIVLGAFGAVAFKGQLPGGASFQMSQDLTAGTTTTSATGPVAPAPAPAPPAVRPE